LVIIGGSDAGVMAGLASRKRIDIVAAALHEAARVDRLDAFDLSYTPPLSSPWDPLQVAAQAWLRAGGRGDAQ
jgi:hypothetical protein